MKSEIGVFDLDVPKDRNCSFELQIVKKNQTHMSSQSERKTLSLYKVKEDGRYISKAFYTVLGVRVD